MRPLLSLLSFLTTLSLGAGVLHAQTLEASSSTWTSRQRLPLRLLAYSGTLGFSPGAAHLGGAVGSELTHASWGKNALLQPIELGYLSQEHFGRGAHLDTGLLYQRCARFGLCLAGGLMGGVERLRYPGTVYTLSESGYRASTGSADTSLRLGLALTVSQQLLARSPRPLRLSLTYRQLALLDFLPEQGLPIFARTQLGLELAMPLRPVSRHSEE